MQLNGASALVVGGAGGFGEATVRRLHAAGASVVIADLAEDKGKALAAELGERALYVQTDVTSEESVDAAIASAVELGPLRANVIVHGGPAAGKRIINRQGEPYPVATFRRTVEIFLVGTYHVLSKAAAAMSKNEPIEGQRGVVITTASIAGFEGQIGQSDYSAAKGGVIGMTLTAARDLGAAGIRVMCIAPGVFFTPAYGSMTREDAEARFASNVPNPKRMGEADEYAKLAASIVDNDYLNGTTIRIDGAMRFNI